MSIADSFAAAEIASRLRISRAAAVFTQDVVLRGGRALPLYARVTEAGAPAAVVLPADGGAELRLALRDGDEAWGQFLTGPGGAAAEVAAFSPRVADAHEITNILFSSGTTVGAVPRGFGTKEMGWRGSRQPLRGLV